MNLIKNRYKNGLIWALWGLIAGLTLYFNLYLHQQELITHLFYLPIILSILSWGRKGFWLVATSALVLLLIEIISYTGKIRIDNLIRLAFFFIIGGVLIKLIEGKRRAEETSRTIKNQLDEVLEHQVNVLKNSNLDLQQELAGLRETEGQIKGDLKQKEEEVREILHRMKNNFQMIYGLFEISLHSSPIQDEASKELLLESKNRIQTMAAIHDILYQVSDINEVNLAHYLERLLKHLEKAYRLKNKTILLESKFESVIVSIQQAIPCGLILNELMTNAYKYAFTEKDTGLIKVKLTKTPQGFLFRFEDNGKGLPVDFDWTRDATFGLQLVNSLIKQLKGEVSWDSIDGLSIIMRVEV